MSVKIMGQVWDLDLPANKLLVLLAMADHADHEGNNIFPSRELIAWKTGYSIRQVQRIINSLVADGILKSTKRPGETTLYRIDISKGKLKHPRGVGQNVTPPVTSNVTPTCDIAVSPKSSLEPSIKDSNTSKEDVLTQPQKAEKPPTPHALMKNAIVAAFGWKSEDVTNWGIINKVSSDLRKVNVSPDEVQALYNYVAGLRFTTFGPGALSTHVPDWRASQKPTASIYDNPRIHEQREQFPPADPWGDIAPDPAERERILAEIIEREKVEMPWLHEKRGVTA